MRRVSATIHGRVHGVGFRAQMVREARVHGVTGWVENRPDGTVALEAQGDGDAVAALLAWCAQGPPAARVTRVTTAELAVVPDEVGFAQRR